MAAARMTTHAPVVISPRGRRVRFTPHRVSSLPGRNPRPGASVGYVAEDGVGRILVRFGDRMKDFHVHVIYASRKLIDANPAAVSAFLAGWLDSVQYMREHSDETIQIAERVSEVSHSVASRNYDELMPIFNPTGRFNPKALDVLARSFVELGLFPSAPDMSKLYTEAYLPK